MPKDEPNQAYPLPKPDATAQTQMQTQTQPANAGAQPTAGKPLPAASVSYSPSAKRQCLHCGTPFTPRNADDQFCCAGCHAVHQLIEAQGLNHFYALRQGISEPVSGRAAEPQDWTWLQALAAQAEQNASAATAPATPAAAQTTRVPELELAVDGIHCVGCRWLIGQIFLQQPAHGTIEIDMQAHRILFSWHVAPENETPANAAGVKANAFSATAFAEALRAYGYLLLDPALPANAQDRRSLGGADTTAGAAARASAIAQDPRKRLLPRLLLCGVFALNAVLLGLPGQMGMDEETFPLLRLFRLLVFLCATLAVGLAGSYFLRRSLRESSTTTKPKTANRAYANSGKRSAWQRYDFGRGVAFSLFGCYIAVLLGRAIGLPGTPGAELMAGISFVLLLLAFIFRK